MRGDPIEAYKMRHRYNSQNLFQTMNIANTRGHRFKVRGQSLKTHGAGLYSVDSASNVLPGWRTQIEKGSIHYFAVMMSLILWLTGLQKSQPVNNISDYSTKALAHQNNGNVRA